MKENTNEKYSIFKDRYFIVALCFILFGGIIVLQLVNLQIIHGKEYDEASQRRVVKERKVIAARGSILDRNGIPIAVNRQGFTVHIVKTDVDSEKFNEILLRLANILGKNNDTYSRQISKYLTFNPVTFNGRTWDEIKKWQMNEDILGLKDNEVADEPEAVFRLFRDKFKIDKKINDEDAYKIITLQYEILLDKWKFDNGGSICIAKNVSPFAVAEIEEKHHLLSGVITDIEPIRRYIDAKPAAHVLGYVRGITAEQYEYLQHEGYSKNDIVGQSGVELAAERYLKGNDGMKKVEVNVSGRLTDELFGKPAVPGNDIVLTLDMNLQKVAMESLERNIKLIREMGGKNNFGDADAGAVVALDVNSGEVLVAGAYPSYDPAIFIAGADDKDAQKAISDLNDPDNKLTSEFNRAIAGTYAPGSTFKPLTAIAALEEGVITPQTPIYDRGVVNIGGKDFFCLEFKHGHGTLTLKPALETSCNIYFHEIGYRTGVDNISKWAKYFGLGSLTGIDIPGESKGILACREYKENVIKENWWIADTAQAAIGQIYHSFTPVQLASYIATIANGGKRYRPFLIKRVVKFDGSIVNETVPEYEQLPIKPETIDAIKDGMVAVTTSIDGTAQRAFKDFPFEVAGKTGTAETGRESKESSNALFVCYAPAHKPEIAVAVVVEKGVWGSYTAAIARDILEEYFGLNNRNRYDDIVEPCEAVFTR